jgi:DNA-binding MarR family transcriptional regulator
MIAAVTSADRDPVAPVAERPAPTGPSVDQVARLLDAVREMFMQAKNRQRQAMQHSDQGRLSVLFTLQRTGRQRPSVLAKELHLDLSTVSRHLRQLEEEGMIAKSTDADDKRAFQVELTDRGDAMVREFWTKRVEEVHGALGHWAAQDVTQLTDLLHRFVGDTEGCFK